ncbi:ABC transporter ATP-binding protein [soil metagenome]
MTSVCLDHIRKSFGSTVALDDINLKINAGELFFLLGPSGCGKSTLLRLIAGLHAPTSGKMWFNDRDVTSVPTDQRNAVMCFQSYALWPHMTVASNIRFGLQIHKKSAKEQDAKVAEVLRLVQMEKYADRKPNQLSGGQQQRVALARALAVDPACLLLDEPLSNLDSKLRLEMRSEIRRICKAAGSTNIYVTHDQKEALSVADRIAILKDGKLTQVGTPSELYHKPQSAFVADFIGQTNLFPGKVVGREGSAVQVDTPIGRLHADAPEGAAPLPESVTVSIRPEQMEIVRPHHSRLEGNRLNRLVGKPVEWTFLGEASEHGLEVNGHKFKVVSTPPMFDVPEQLEVEFDPHDVVVLAS